MQEKFSKNAALRAAMVFKKFIETPAKKAELDNSNKALIVLTTIAYFGECSNIKLRNAIPLQFNVLVDELVKLGYLSKHRDGKTVYYKYKAPFAFSTGNSEYNEHTLYLFANALLNVGTYIKKGIKSWNVLALMLETALNEKFDNKPVHITESTIKSVIGNQANKLLVRKNLQDYGVIRPVSFKGNRAYGGDFKLNKEAYIIEVK